MTLMGLVREWRRQLVGASSAALIVPGAMFAALIVLALAGGFGRLGSLGQVFSGPSTPSARLAAGPLAGVRPSGSFVSGVALSAAQVTAAGAQLAGAGTTAAASVRASVGPGTSSGRTGPYSQAVSEGGGRTPSGGTLSGGTRSSGGGPPPARPAPRPTVVDKVAGAVTSVTKQVAPPVGPLATQTLQSAASTLDRAAPVPAPGNSITLRGGVSAHRTVLAHGSPAP